MISTLSESWRLEQILSLNTDAAANHTNQMNGVGGNEYRMIDLIANITETSRLFEMLKSSFFI